MKKLKAMTCGPWRWAIILCLLAGLLILGVAIVGAAAPPSSPSGLTATLVDSSRINLAWTDNSVDENGFRIESATNAEFTAGQIMLTVGANVTSYSDTSVYAGRTFYYRVRAFNSGGSSSPSNVVNVPITSGSSGAAPAAPNTPTATTPSVPAAPSRLAVAASGGHVNLTWRDNSNNETGLRLERAANTSFTSGLISFTLPANSSSYSDTTAAALSSYYYRVFAVNTGGDSRSSDIISVSTPALNVVPAAPIGLTVAGAGPRLVILKWTDNSDNETGFRIERASDSSFSANAVSIQLSANTTIYSDTDVVLGATYYYRLFALGDGGPSSASNTVSATTRLLTPSTPVSTPSPTATPVPTPVVTPPAPPPDAPLELLSDSNSVKVGQTFTVAINTNVPSGQQVSAVEAFIDFDPAKLEVVDSDSSAPGIHVAPGTVLGIVLNNTADNAAGHIDFSAGKLGGYLPSGNFTVATITFRAKADTGGVSLPIAVSQSSERTSAVTYNGDFIAGTHGDHAVTITPP